MIQRKQTLLLLFAIIMLGIAIYHTGITTLFPALVHEGSAVPLTESTIGNILFPALAHGVSAVLCVIAIFLYGNRKLQIKVAYVAMASIVGALVFEAVNCFSPCVSGACPLRTFFNMTNVLALAALALIDWAIRAIKADDRLVRSLDRIR